jgi:ADP-heptose:LPS heptosyltransferase
MLNAQPGDRSHPTVGPTVMSKVIGTISESIRTLRRYLDFLRWLLVLRPVDSAASRHEASNSSGPILVVHPCRIGDMILWLDAARGLRELYPAPAYRIVLLADTTSASLVRSQPYFDCVLELDRARFSKSPLYRWKILRRLARERFSLALNPAGWQDYYVADSIIGATGATERVGWSLRPDSRVQGDRWMTAWRAGRYTRLLSMAEEGTGVLHLNAEFLHRLGHHGFEAHAPKLNLEQKLHPVADSPPYYVLCPGAVDPIRRWPPERFAAVAESIFGATGMRGSICGTIAEKPLATAICRLANAPLSDRTGSLSLEQFAQFSAGASLVISNDSGALHVAAASGATTLCIEGGGTFGWCVPYGAAAQEGMSVPQAVWHPMECFGCDWHCRFKISRGGAAPCVVNVAAREVAAVALSMLASRGPRNEGTSY